MATPTWAKRELPLLEAINDRATSLGGPRWEDLPAATGLPTADVQLGLRRLYDNGWIDGLDVTGMGDAGFELIEIRLLEPGLQAVGAWPADPFVELVDVLRSRIESERDPATKTRLERFLEAVQEVGQSVATSVVTDVVKRTIGI
jgi:hypothetical protein